MLVKLLAVLLALAYTQLATLEGKPNEIVCTGKNEEYSSCMPNCPPTCDRPAKGDCSRKCLTKGCECVYGYYRQVNGDNECVLPHHCINYTETPNPFEIFTPYGTVIELK